jgi:LysM repeat protein
MEGGIEKRSFCMKNFTKLFGITLFVMVIGFTVLFAGACKSEPHPEPPPPQDDPLPPPPPPEILEEYHEAYIRHHNDIILNQSQSYTVQSGDTMVIIARRFYSDSSLYPLIFGASDEVSDPDRIEVGTILTIPDLELNWNDAKAKKSIDELILEMAGIEEHRGRNNTAAMLRNHIK